MMRDLTGLEGDRLDRAFLQDMLWHHMGAVMMSQQLLMRGVADHEQVEVLAKTIRDEQRAEIFQMQRWLRAWFGGGWQLGMCGGVPAGCPEVCTALDGAITARSAVSARRTQVSPIRMRSTPSVCCPA